MTLRIIDGPTARQLLPPAAAVTVMADALRRFSAGESVQPERVGVPSARGELLVMPAGDAGGNLGVKVVTLFQANAGRGLATINGLVVLFDPETGQPCSIIDGAAVTEVRTAAVSAVATDALARADASRLTIIGAGVQARAHLAALAAVRPWTDCRLASRNPGRAADLAAWATRTVPLPAVAVCTVEDAVRGADVICTTTNAITPVFPADAVAERGVHVNAIGTHTPTARELPGDLVGRASVFVESRAAARREAGDLCQAEREGHLSPDAAWTELGEVIAGTRPGRTDPDQTTVFKSVGIAAEDLAAALAIHHRAIELDAGTAVTFEP